MKKGHLCLFWAVLPQLFSGEVPSYREELHTKYESVCQCPSDINEHVPLLCELAKECPSVVEIGVRNVVSTWGLLEGLADNPDTHRTYLGVDLELPPEINLRWAEILAEKNQIHFQFCLDNDLDIDAPSADLLFIDSLHTYCHLMSELERFSPQIRKYIALHDTSGSWGVEDDVDYRGDYSEYPDYLDRTKRGLWAAVVDFLADHPEWTLKERRTNNNGFTILQRACTRKESLANGVHKWGEEVPRGSEPPLDL